MIGFEPRTTNLQCCKRLFNKLSHSHRSDFTIQLPQLGDLFLPLNQNGFVCLSIFAFSNLPGRRRRQITRAMEILDKGYNKHCPFHHHHLLLGRYLHGLPEADGRDATGGRHSSVDSSAPTILSACGPGFQSQAHSLMLFQFSFELNTTFIYVF